MNKEIKNLKIIDIIDRPIAVSSDDGEFVFKEIEKNIESGYFVFLDFEGIMLLTTAFLNSAIAPLYISYTSDQINEVLRLVNVEDEDKILFKKVIERAKEYFANRKEFENSAKKAIYGGENN